MTRIVELLNCVASSSGEETGRDSNFQQALNLPRNKAKSKPLFTVLSGCPQSLALVNVTPYFGHGPRLGKDTKRGASYRLHVLRNPLLSGHVLPLHSLYPLLGQLRWFHLLQRVPLSLFKTLPTF